MEDIEDQDLLRKIQRTRSEENANFNPHLWGLNWNHNRVLTLDDPAQLISCESSQFTYSLRMNAAPASKTPMMYRNDVPQPTSLYAPKPKRHLQKRQDYQAPITIITTTATAIAVLKPGALLHAPLSTGQSTFGQLQVKILFMSAVVLTSP